ncbi:MAG: hypothetical protein ACRDRA_17675 [Pseudonocardiaceae bacterium]
MDEPALVQTLRDATDLGWQADQLVSLAVAQGSFAGAEDPAAVLQWRIQQHIQGHQPTPHVAEPSLADINRWRSIIEQTVPWATVEDQQWHRVWRHAAGGASEGLDAEAAMRGAAEGLAAKLAQDPMDDYRYTTDALIAEFTDQRHASDGAGSALPWLGPPSLRHPAQ